MTETGTEPTVEPTVEPGRYGCPACPDRFESVGEKRHIRDTHSTTES